MDSLFFMGLEGVMDIMLLEVSAVMVILEPEEGNFGEGGMFQGDTEHREAEKAEEKFDKRHGEW